MADRKMTQLAAPEAAIASYLDELLHTATSTALQEEQVQPARAATDRRAPPKHVKAGSGGSAASSASEPDVVSVTSCDSVSIM